MQAGVTNEAYMYALIGVAYVAIISALVVDITKRRKLIREHQSKTTGGGRKSPKQIKHEQEAAERLAQIEAARKAAKGAKSRRAQRSAEATADSAADAGSETAGASTDTSPKDEQGSK
jgi:hypothetical protein